MRIDVTAFDQITAIDTCAIWNVLSSTRLTAAAQAKQRWFVVADYVRYEALERPRTNPEPCELALQARFRDRLQKQQGFSGQTVSLDDLQAVANMPIVSRLGQGEIAALALAHKMRMGFMRIPMHSAHPYRFQIAQRSNLKPPGVPISNRPPF